MTDFDLGEPAPDADEEPDDDQDSGEETTVSDPPETTTDPEPEPEPEPESETADETTDTGSESESEDEVVDPAETGPAFDYSEVKQSPMYGHEDAWNEFDDLIGKEVVPQLLDRGIRDHELREIHTAALELLADNIDELPERVAENRIESER